MKVPNKFTPLHRWHEGQGGQFSTVAGWECVSTYGDLEAEAAAANCSVGIRDVTPLSKIDIQGRHSSQLIHELFGTQVPNVGGCALASSNDNQYRVCISRLTAERYLAIAAPGCQKHLYHVAVEGAREKDCVHVTDVTSVYAAFHLIGPRATEVLKRVGRAQVDTVQSWHCVQSVTARVWSLLLRHEKGQSPAWLVLLSRDFAEYVWEAVLAAGHEFAIRPFGSMSASTSVPPEAFDVATV